MKKKDCQLHLQYSIHESVQFGVLLAIVGGFLDAYTFIGRGGVFANAQTGNIVFLGIYAAQGEWKQALVSVPPIFAFVIGVIAAESIKDNSSQFFTMDWRQLVLILECIILFIIGFIPDSVPNIFVTVTISFAASVQVTSFSKLIDSPYTTTMCTGNLKSASLAAYLAFTKKNHESVMKSIRYFMIIVSFLFGALLGGILTVIVGVRSIWITVIILIFTIILFNIYERKGFVKDSIIK